MIWIAKGVTTATTNEEADPLEDRGREGMMIRRRAWKAAVTNSMIAPKDEVDLPRALGATGLANDTMMRMIEKVTTSDARKGRRIVEDPTMRIATY